MSAREHQRGAAKRRGRQEPRRQRADERAQDMRHDKPDEADRAGDRDAAADGERGAEDGQEPQRGASVDADAGGGVLAERQRVERRGRGQQQRPAGKDERRGEPDVDASSGRRASRAAR